MKKNEFLNFLIFLVLLLFDIATNEDTNFLVSLTFLIVIFLKYGSLLNIFYLLIIDCFFGKFIGFFTFPTLVGVLFFNFISSKIKVPIIIQAFGVYVFLFIFLFGLTQNLFYSIEFFVESLLLSVVLVFITSKVSYEQERNRV
jgi:hypothetical protein